MRQNSAIGAFALILLVCTGSASAAPTCIATKCKAAEREINKMLSVLVENAPVECLILPAGDGKRCGIICATQYATTEEQRTATMVWIVGASGKQFNKLGVSNFSSVMYVDRTTGVKGYGYEIDAQEAARIQSLAYADKMSAQEILLAVKRATKVKPARKH